MTVRLAALILTALLVVPLVADAQPTTSIRRIGILSPAPAGSPYSDFREALRELGYVEGKDIVLEFRLAGGYARLPELAADLVRLPVDVIVTDGGTAVARAALNATRTIPIVMGSVGGDPVADGLVASLARPGGNLTGFTSYTAALAGKRLQLLKEIVPAATRVAVLSDPETAPYQLRVGEVAARSLNVQLVALPVRGLADLDAAFATASRQRADGLLQLSSRMLSDNRTAIAERSLKHRLPGVFELAFQHTAALASHGPNIADNFRRAAVYVDRILKGARAGDLPIEQPTKFHLVVNLRTARVLGLTISPTVLLQATRIIE